MRDIWHRVIRRAGILLRRLAQNPGNYDTIWIRDGDGALMRGDSPILPDPSSDGEPLAYIERSGAECVLDASENSSGFIVDRSTESNVIWENLGVGESRVVVFTGRWGVSGGDDPIHTYFWQGQNEPIDELSPDGYQYVKFVKVSETDIVGIAQDDLQEPAGY